jgi:predicted PurR-regulated permease PerM
MDDNEHHDPKNESSNSLVLLVYSVAAILGVLASLILLNIKRIKPYFQKLRSSTESITEEERIDGMKTGSPLSEQTPNPPVVSSVVASRPAREEIKPVNAKEPSAGKRWSTPTRYIMGVLLFLAMLVVLFIGRSAIPLVLAAALLALFTDPMIQFFIRRLRMKRGLAVGFTYLLVVILLLMIPLLLIPSLVDAVNFVMNIDSQLVAQRVSETLQSFSTTLQANPTLAAFLKPTLDSLMAIVENFASTTQAEAPVVNLSAVELTNQIGKALGAAAKFLGPTFSVLASIFITLFISLQMTLTVDEMKSWSADLIPEGFGPELNGLLRDIRRTWVGFLRGQMSLMLVIGMVIWLGGLILGLPSALFLGVIAGVFELIPSIGPVLAAIPAVLLALFFGSTHFALNNVVFALLVVGFYALVQLLENQILVPRIMGDAVDLPPLVVLIGTIAGAGAFGIMGALLATPFIATGNLVFRYVYRKILEDQPAPPPVEQKPGFLDNMRGFISRLGKRVSKGTPGKASNR